MFKVKRRTQSDGKGKIYLIGVLLSIALLVITSFILAIALASMKDPSSMVGIMSLSGMLISGAVSGFTTCRIKGDGGFGIAVLSALTVTMIIMLLGIILGGGRLSGGTLMNCGCYMGVSSFAGFIGKRRPGHKRRKR